MSYPVACLFVLPVLPTFMPHSLPVLGEATDLHCWLHFYLEDFPTL